MIYCHNLSTKITQPFLGYSLGERGVILKKLGFYFYQAMKIILSLVHEPHSNEMRVVLPRGQNYMEHLPKLLATVK